MKPVSELLSLYLPQNGVIVDPFCGSSTHGTLRNDITHNGGIDAVDWLDSLVKQNIIADAVLLDPPYSPRQMSEAYKMKGIKPTMKDTQNARLYKECKDRLRLLLKDGGIAITCGWNSTGFGKGFEKLHIRLINHGSAHNDTIVMVERKHNGGMK